MIKKNRICTLCVMDTSDSKITFDVNGICDHCTTYFNHTLKNWQPVGDNQSEMKSLVDKIKHTNQGREFDCIVGMSGGTDSSYLVHIAVEMGLRPLVFHVDTGWNSLEAVSNIESIVDNLHLDLYTQVVDWEEMRDLQLAYFKSAVPHIDTPQDHAIFATMYKFADNHNIKFILTGANLATECIRNPIEWMYYQSDSVQLNDIHNKFGTRPLVNFPITSIFYHKIWLPYFQGIKVVRPLNLLNYDKVAAIKILTDKYGWKNYPQKHFESRFTSFYEGYWLPKKFGYDPRKVQFSSLIITGQMSRSEALKKLETPALDPSTARKEFEYVASKLEISTNELQGYFDLPNKTYRDYRSNKSVYFIGSKFMKMFGFEIGGKR